MRKIYLSVILTSSFLVQSVFADDKMMSENKACEAVAKACVAAGYDKAMNDKNFWFDCMRPVLMGQSVTDVTVDADSVKSCRKQKIEQMKKDLKDFQKMK